MVSFYSLLSVALLLLSQLAAAYPNSLAVRSASAADMRNFRGAILVKNGIPTSCELALIDNRAAFVAANCLDYSEGQVNIDTKYEVYFDGAKGLSPGRVAVNLNKIRVHTQYSPVTFANNVAVVEFDFNDHGDWVNYLAVHRLEWKDIVYVRRLLESPSSMTWSMPSVTSQLNSDPGCAKASGLFASNQNDILCSKSSVSSPVSDRCSMPYGSLYGVASKAMAISALYSHTVVYSDKMCNGGDAYNFYTQLSNYTRFAYAILGRRPFEHIENLEEYLALKHITSFRMANSRASNDQGTTMFGGDLLAAQRTLLNLPVKPIDNPPSSTTTATSTEASKSQEQPAKPTDTKPVDDKPDDHASSKPQNASKSEPSRSASGSQSATPTKPSKGDNIWDMPTKLLDPADYPPGFGTGGLTRAYDDDDEGEGGMERDESKQSTSVQKDKTGQAKVEDEDWAKGVSKSTVIALSVTIPLLVIMASAGAYFMYHSHRKRKSVILLANE
ncbi:hypothetical protein GGH91_000913 [Coemansia sp. RSA 2671]|nr:hypothetical protein LPJ60_002537 [Coemansia sp. RSA 2675]KAJ2349263.1 hypothetical protein GGH91_000913 [Coemansia sp. RSA 2671]